MSALGLSGFSAALENRQTNRLEMKPRRQRSQRPFPKSRDSTAVTSAPISETDVHCAHHHAIYYVQSNVISGGFLKVESLDFWMTPSPNEIVRGKSGVKRSDKKRQQTCRQLSLPLIKSCRLLSLEIVAYAA